MRRVLLFAAFLLLLGLTTATAASFDVQAEDITSFSQPVTISVPVATTPWFLFRPPPAPGGLSTTPDEGGPHKWDVDPSGGSSIDALLAESTETKYYVWSSGPLTSVLDFQNQVVTFFAYLTAGGNEIYAALLDCPAGEDLPSTDCDVLGFGGPGTPGQSNVVVVPLGAVDATVAVGHELRLKVINGGTQSWKIEWGYKTNRESNLTIGAPSS